MFSNNFPGDIFFMHRLVLILQHEQIKQLICCYSEKYKLVMLLIVYDPVLISVFGYLANYYLLVKSNTLFSSFIGCFVIQFF